MSVITIEILDPESLLQGRQRVRIHVATDGLTLTLPIHAFEDQEDQSCLHDELMALINQLAERDWADWCARRDALEEVKRSSIFEENVKGALDGIAAQKRADAKRDD